MFGLAVRAFAGGLLGVDPADVARVEAVTVDINCAALAELQALPGVGPDRAAAIILHRLRHGPFRCLEDLRGVDGLGPRTVELLRPFVRW